MNKILRALVISITLYFSVASVASADVGWVLGSLTQIATFNSTPYVLFSPSDQTVFSGARGFLLPSGDNQALAVALTAVSLGKTVYVYIIDANATAWTSLGGISLSN